MVLLPSPVCAALRSAFVYDGLFYETEAAGD
jgi:hypothetical protein